MDNGRTYYYSFVAYDRGESDEEIFPAENSKFITVLPTGEVFTDKNTAVVTPTSQAAGYILNDSITVSPSPQFIGTGSNIVLFVVMESVTGLKYWKMQRLAQPLNI